MSETEREFEEQLRELLADDAYTIRPSPVPYPAIRRQGVIERRRRVAVAGAALVTLAAVPVGAFALTGGGAATADTAATLGASASATQAATPKPSPTPSGPVGPVSPQRQLLDGITLEQAADGLAKCIAYDQETQASRANATAVTAGTGSPTPAWTPPDLGDADEYRIILAMHSTGDSNATGDGIWVVAVKEQPKQTRLLCRVVDGEAASVGSSVGNDDIPDAPPVLADINGGKLYQQSFIDKGNWKLPFRWGVIGTVEPSVAKVTVSYGGSTAEAVLDHGWFVASATLNQQVTASPHIKGYDADGKLLYDSATDKSYEQTLP
ncbi:hypothetical protein ABZ896_14755 [Streptomyces sp. NPDC047072]|uniref:hypothetical protein n=1 Tax=Streptomyces sp. NPDC047072 TaxID=3154809 RepID=UPI0033E7F80D